MKKKILGLLLITLALTGCGKIPKLSNGEEAVVTFNDGNMISVDDLYNEMKNEYALSVLINKIDKYVLETKFEDNITTAKETAKSYMKSMRKNYDSDTELLNVIYSYTGISSLEAYEDMYYINVMKEYATKEYAKTLITSKEIKKYYESSIYGDIEVSHILIVPDVTDTMTDEEKETAEQKALEKIDLIISKLESASDVATEFTDLVVEYSDDEDTKENGGSLGKINTDTLSESYDNLVKAAYELEVGEYSTSVIKTELGYHVIYKTNEYEKPTLDESTTKIINILAEEKVENTDNISVTAMQYYRKDLGMNIVDDEIAKSYSNYISQSYTK